MIRFSNIGCYILLFSVSLNIGPHTINVLYEGMPIEGCPFTSRAYHAPAIAISSIQPGIVGSPVEFNSKF